MKEFKIGEALTVSDSIITPTFDYKSLSCEIYYDNEKLDYIELDNNRLMIIEKDNTIINTVKGKSFKLVCDDEGRLETVGIEISKTYSLDLNDYKIITNSDGLIETTKNNQMSNPLISTISYLNGKKVKIKYIHEAENDTVVYTKSSKKQSLFKAYGSDLLKFNHRYNLNVCIDKQNFSMNFNSKIDPFFTSVDKIRKDTGELLDNVENSLIENVIYSNSKYAKEKIEDKDIDGIPSYVKNYVRYKTDMDLVNAIYLTLSGRIGSINKRIGIIQVDKTMKVPFIKDMLYYFQEQERIFEDLLDSATGVNIASSFVKAKKTSYPVNARNSF